MFRGWVRLLPYGLVVFLAKKHQERISSGNAGYEACSPFPGEILSWKVTPDKSLSAAKQTT